jgi:hydroxymethylpyrimidine pyrophosphatase-like HAD family hydrolase
MLENSTYSFAMENASEFVKSKAKEIIGHCDDDSIMKTIMRIYS